MYENLRDPGELDDLKPNSLLIHYPTEGQPTSRLDLSNPASFTLYEIKEINGNVITLEIVEDNPGADDDQDINNEYKKTDGPLLITKSELIEQKKWWKRPD